MTAVWGDLHSMALHFLRALTIQHPDPVVLAYRIQENSYFVGTWAEYAHVLAASPPDNLRLMCHITADELLNIMLARHMDFLTEAKDAGHKTRLQTGQ